MNDYDFDDIEKRVEDALKNANVGDNVYNSIESIMQCIDVIVVTNGKPGWSLLLVNNEGAPLISDSEKNEFEYALAPIVPLILSIFSDEQNQTGGAIGTVTLPKSISLPSKPKLNLTMKSAMSNMVGDISAPTIGIDEAIQMIADKINAIDVFVQNFAKTSPAGISRFVNNYDVAKDDPAPLGIFGYVPIVTPIGPAAHAISRIKIPARMIVFFVYTILDIVRIIMSTRLANVPNVRKIFSIVVAIVDILKGDWKSSILSFAGFYGEYPMIFGYFSKLFLQTFYLLNPQIRESVLYGIKSTTVSLISGFLLKIFQVLAPAPMRMLVSDALKKLHENVIGPTDTAITAQGVSSEGMVITPSFEDIQTMQAFVADPPRLCSAEFQDAIKTLTQSTLLRIVLQLLNIPINEREIRRVCGKTFGETPQPYIDNLAKTIVNKKRENAKEAAEDVVAAVDEKVEGAKEAAEDVGKEVVVAVDEKVEGAKEAAEDAVAAVDEKVEGAKEAAEDAVAAVDEKVEGVKEAAEDVGKEVVTAVDEKVEGAKEAAENVVAAVDEKVEGVKEAAEEVGKEAKIGGHRVKGHRVRWLRNIR